MLARPNDWNVVISGDWNPAILSPDGIRKRLFKLPEGTPLQIELAIDRPGLFRVIHEGVAVSLSSRQLDLSVQTNDIASLEKACCIGQRAIEALPETPLAAAGVNFRYPMAVLPDPLIDLVKSGIDDAYSDADYIIVGSVTQRSLDHPPGLVNVEISKSKDGGGMVLMNFHLASISPIALQEWLNKTKEFWSVSQKLLSAMKVTVEERL